MKKQKIIFISFISLIIAYILIGCSEKRELGKNVDSSKSFIELGNLVSAKYLEKNLLNELKLHSQEDSQILSQNINQGDLFNDSSNNSNSALINSESKAKYMKLLNSVFSYLNSAQFDNTLYERINKAKSLINNAKDSLELQKALIEVDKSQKPVEEAIMKMMVQAGFKDQKELQAISILYQDDKDVVAFNQKFEIMLKNKMEKFNSRFIELQTLLMQKIQEFRKKN